MGLVAPRPAMRQHTFSQLKTVCVFLGPYRNLTTLTASMLALHPRCQVLNHGGLRVLTEPQLNFLRDSSETTFRRFCQFAIDESQGGEGGDAGGAITLSHAFEHQVVQDVYLSRFGRSLLKPTVEIVIWKESLAVSNFIRDQGISLYKVLQDNPKIRFLMPIRNPLDCAISNCRTGHYKRFRRVKRPESGEVLTSIVEEIAWFRELQRLYPERFFSFLQGEMNDRMLLRLARFLHVKRPRFSWTRIKGESNVQGGGENGSVEGRGTGRGIGTDGGSPEGDWSPCRRRGGRGGLPGAGAAVERQPEARRGAAAAAWRIAGGAVP